MRIENKSIIVERLVPKKETIESSVYIADDGKEFKDESSCKRYEQILEGKKYLQEIKQDDLDRILPYLLTDTYKVSDVMCFKYKITHDSEIKLKVIAYLDSKRCHYLFSKDFDKFHENDDVLIVSWTEDEDTQYTKIFLFDDVLKQIEEYATNLKSRYLQ